MLLLFNFTSTYVPVVSVGYGCAGHFDVVASEEEQQSVTRQTYCVRY